VVLPKKVESKRKKKERRGVDAPWRLRRNEGTRGTAYFHINDQRNLLYVLKGGGGGNVKSYGGGGHSLRSIKNVCKRSGG